MSDIKVTIGGDAAGFMAATALVKKEGMSIARALRVPLAGAGLAGVGLAAKSLVNEMDNIGDEADKLGVSTRFFQEMGNAARVSGSSVEQVSQAAKLLAVNLADAKDGDKVSKTLESIGLNGKTLAALPLEEKFRRLAKAITEQSDSASKLNAASDLLGRTGKELVPTLELIASGKGVAGIFSDESIRNAQKFNDWITTTTQNLKSNFVKGVELARDALSGKLFTDPLNKEGQKKEEGDAAKREAEAIAGEKAKAAADEAAAADKASKLVDDTLDKLKKEVAEQNLKVQGKEKEAAVLKRINDLEEKTKRKLTDKQRSDVADAAGKLFEASRPQPGGPNLIQSAGMTSLRAMGAGLPGRPGMDTAREGINLDKQRNELLKKISDMFSKNDTSWDSKHMTEIRS